MMEHNTISRDEWEDMRNTNPEAPGRVPLMIGSIGITIIASIGMLIAIVLLAFSLVSTGSAYYMDDLFGSMMTWVVAGFAVGMIIGCGFNLVAGIMGIKRAKYVKKYKAVFVLGIIMLVFKGLGLLSLFGTTELFGFSIVLVLGEIALAIAYFVGANMNRKAYLEWDAELARS